MLGCSQVGKAAGFGPVIHGFESYHPSFDFCEKAEESRGKQRKAGESGKKTFKKNTSLKPQKSDCYPVEYRF